MKKHLLWSLPVLVTLFLTPFTPFIDISLSNLFYDPVTNSFSSDFFLKLIFKFGPYPAILCSVVALFVLIFSFFKESLEKWRPAALLVFLTLVIGSGLIVNLIFKDHWGRPRPRQIVEFGGMQEYRPFYLPNFGRLPEPSKSFPSGHSSAGFALLALCFASWRHNKTKILWASAIFTAILGGLLSFARIAQGGHFFSDVLLSLLIMWLTALILDRWIYDRG